MFRDQEQVFGAVASSSAEPTTFAPIVPEDGVWPTLDEMTVQYIRRVLEREQGCKARTAVVLGIDPRTLDRVLAKMRKGRVPTMQTLIVARGLGAEP